MLNTSSPWLWRYVSDVDRDGVLCSFVRHRESDSKHQTVLIGGSRMVVGRRKIRIRT
ncbi:hypothetical protein A2U01_0064870, partial [Trifolium medium]|nr:hypothetical protein [Trifolium medium]